MVPHVGAGLQQMAMQRSFPPYARRTVRPALFDREESMECSRRGVEQTPRRLSQRRQAPPAACAANHTSGAAAKPRHFLRPSLLATGLTEPADVVQHCLALFRKADLPGLCQHLPDSYASSLESGARPASAVDTAAAAAEAAAAAAGGEASGGSPASSSSGASSSSSSSSSGAGSSSSRSSSSGMMPLELRRPWLRVGERGPLAPLAGLLDVGARRVLPGHLLRRSQVLSTLWCGPGAFQQRTSLTACTGESSVFAWQLAWHPAEEEEEEEQGQGQGQEEGQGQRTLRGSGSGISGGTRSKSSSSGGGGIALEAAQASRGSGRWVIESVRRDTSCDLPLPTTPHPKAAPEAIVRAQLAALQTGDVLGASCFSMRAGRGITSRRTSLVSHHDALRSRLQQEPYGLLVRHAAVQLGAAALPTQRDMLQEVAVLAADGGSARFVWRLALSSHGCWMVTGIFTEEEAAQLLQAGAQR